MAAYEVMPSSSLDISFRSPRGVDLSAPAKVIWDWLGRRCHLAAQTIAEGFRKLPAEEKIRLLQELWDEIAEEAAGMPLHESHRRLLDERIGQHDENPGDVEPWEKTRDDILSGL